MNINMHYLIINVPNTQWIEFKVKTIEKELMKSTKFHCLALMRKYISKTMDTMDYLFFLALQLIIKNSYLNNYSEKLFCQANCFDFQSNQNSFFLSIYKNLIRLLAWHIKFDKSEELMATAWHPNNWWDWWLPEDDF